MTHFTRVFAYLGAIGAAVVFSAVGAFADEVSVAPSRIDFLKSQASSYVIVNNPSPIAHRFAVAAYTWDGIATDPSLLHESNDVVYFPGAFTIAPFSTQRVRVGTTGPAMSAESTYRLVVSELAPPLTERTPGAGVAFSTSFNIPIYVAPLVSHVGIAVDHVIVDRGTLRYTVHATGNVHLAPSMMRLAILGESGPVATIERNSGVVLAQGEREVALPLARAACHALTRIEFVADLGAAKLDSVVTPQRKTCE